MELTYIFLFLVHALTLKNIICIIASNISIQFLTSIKIVEMCIHSSFLFKIKVIAKVISEQSVTVM